MGSKKKSSNGKPNFRRTNIYNWCLYNFALGDRGHRRHSSEVLSHYNAYVLYRVWEYILGVPVIYRLTPIGYLRRKNSMLRAILDHYGHERLSNMKIFLTSSACGYTEENVIIFMEFVNELYYRLYKIEPKTDVLDEL